LGSWSARNTCLDKAALNLVPEETARARRVTERSAEAAVDVDIQSNDIVVPPQAEFPGLLIEHHSELVGRFADEDHLPAAAGPAPGVFPRLLEVDDPVGDPVMVDIDGPEHFRGGHALGVVLVPNVPENRLHYRRGRLQVRRPPGASDNGSDDCQQTDERKDQVTHEVSHVVAGVDPGDGGPMTPETQYEVSF
jgi:hypothetical protein